jgi:hypothetical protein
MKLLKILNFSNLFLEYKLTVIVHLCIRLTWNITKVVKKHSFIEFWRKLQLQVIRKNRNLKINNHNHNSEIILLSIALYFFICTFYMCSNYNYQNLWVKTSAIIKFSKTVSNCQCGFYILEYKLTVNVHLCIRVTWNITKAVKKHSFIEFWRKLQLQVTRKNRNLNYKIFKNGITI